MEGLLVMSAKERERLKIFLRVKGGELQQQAAALCGLDYRHLRRLYQRYCKQGDRGVVHQGRGQPSNRARSAEFKAAVLARYQERYPDFGPTLAAEKLTLDGLAVEHETLRGWLMKAGPWHDDGNASGIGVGANDGRTLASWCNWMARITNGLKSVPANVV
jgi:helix-turn-helix protein